MSVFNRCWARVILESLVRHGVKHICIAPGSRSTPLTLEAVTLQNQRVQNKPRVTCHTHFDERGLGFFALGLAKADQGKVAVIVTSGTAAANLYPAIVEARQTGTDLFILTADRPVELRECGANQAILQEQMFAPYPVAEVNLPRPSTDLSAAWLLSTLSDAYQKQAQNSGVVHINVPFAEPLYGATEEEITAHSWLESIDQWLYETPGAWVSNPQGQVQWQTHPDWEKWRNKKGVILIGRLPKKQTDGLLEWAEQMGWIVICDVQSNVPAPLPHADLWLANKIVLSQLLEVDIVLQFGSGFVSKRVNQFLERYQGEYWIVEQGIKDVDPYHHHRTRFNCDVPTWIALHEPNGISNPVWAIEPLALADYCRKDFVPNNLDNALTETTLAANLERVMPANADLFLGNSLFVRLVDALGRSSKNHTVYTNRGASGIDGLIATAAGIATANERPMVAMVGDTSFLYDLNSLALLQKVMQPMIIFVLNNNGGAIFDLLAVPEDVKQDYYQMPHNLNGFQDVCKMFNIRHTLKLTWVDLQNTLRQFSQIQRSVGNVLVIEVKVSPMAASQLYRYLVEEITDARFTYKNEEQDEA